jgi:ATP-dependent protease ClpP protease subunit
VGKSGPRLRTPSVARRDFMFGAAAMVSACAPGYITVSPRIGDVKVTSNAPPAKNSPQYINFETSISEQSCAILTTKLTEAVDSGVKDIHLFITSGGGSLESAVQAYEAMITLEAKVTTYNPSRVSSAALIIFLAGEDRIAGSNALFQFHTPAIHENDTNKKWRKEYEDALETQAENIYRERTALSPEQIEHLKRQGSLIFNASAALTAGIIKHVVPHTGIPAGAALITIQGGDG